MRGGRFIGARNAARVKIKPHHIASARAPQNDAAIAADWKARAVALAHEDRAAHWRLLILRLRSAAADYRLQRREVCELIERVLREGVTSEMPLTLVAKPGTEMPGQMTLAPILTDCVAHGAQAIWSPEDGAHGNLRVA